MDTGNFDESDIDSMFFNGINLEDAHNILMDEREGTFLLRNSSRTGDYVICVREDNTVNQYTVHVKGTGKNNVVYIREEFPFKNLSALLAFYKTNMFKSTSLKRPVSSEAVILRRSGKEGFDRGNIRSEIAPGLSGPSAGSMRKSAPPDMTKPYDASCRGSHPPLFARVVKPRAPSPYNPNDLTLRVDDIIKVTSRNSKDGKGTGELNGKIGEFPLINVEFVTKDK